MQLKFYTSFLTVVIAVVFPAMISRAQAEPKTISEISLEMVQGSAGPGREFKIVIKNDGTAAYHGKNGVKLVGKYTGKVTTEEFDQLAALVTKNRFQDIKSVFSSTGVFAGSDMPGFSPPRVVTTVIINGKKKKVERPIAVKINSPEAPATELREIENAITSLSTKVKWTKVEK